MKVLFKIFLSLIFCIQYGHSQVVIESRLKNNVIIEDLKQTNTDISGIYRKTLNTGQELNHYLIWLDEGKFYIKKMTRNGESIKSRIEANDFFIFYFPDKDSIRETKIEEPELKLIKDVLGNETGKEWMVVFYGTLEIITLWTTKESVYLYLESVSHSDMSNQGYYEYNLKLKYDPWLKKLIEQINVLERENKLRMKDN